MLASARRWNVFKRDLYKKARWQPVVPEPRPAFICTFLSIFRTDQKTSRNQFVQWRTWVVVPRAAPHRAEIFLSHGSMCFLLSPKVSHRSRYVPTHQNPMDFIVFQSTSKMITLKFFYAFVITQFHK